MKYKMTLENDSVSVVQRVIASTVRNIAVYVILMTARVGPFFHIWLAPMRIGKMASSMSY